MGPMRMNVSKVAGIARAGMAALGTMMFAANVLADTHVYIGTYTERTGKGQGIYHATLNEETGELSEPLLAAQVANPSFLALRPKGRFLYAVSEIGQFEGKPQGSLSAYAIGPAGNLSLVNRVGTGGSITCHLAIDPEGRSVLVANYGSGSVASFPLGNDGRIGDLGTLDQHEGVSVIPRHRKGPHAHSVMVDPSGRRAYAADLGLDKIYIYELDAASGTFSPNAVAESLKTPDGRGPRHIAFHPSGRFAYVNFEITMEVALLGHDPETGALDLREIYACAEVKEEENYDSSAEVLVHPNGKWLYVSNRGPNTISVFRIDQETGRLSHVEWEPSQGARPRGFGIDPSGKFVVAGNQNSGNVVVFRINQETGELDPTGFSIEVPTPANVRFFKD